MRVRHALPALLLACFLTAHADDIQKLDPSGAYRAKLSAAAQQGDANAQVCLGDVYAVGDGSVIKPEPDKAFALYQQAADHGDLEGQRHVAMAYMYGVGVKQDIPRAVSMFRALADKAYAPAYLDMSLMYFNGSGVAEDDEVALDWLKKGAAAGDPDAQIRLAIHYHFGDGIKKDDVAAQEWLAKAITQDIDCLPTYEGLIPYIANVYFVDERTDAEKEIKTGRFGIRFVYAGQKATHIEMMQSSGSEVLDKSLIDALAKASLPRWPKSYVTDDHTMGFWIGEDDPNAWTKFSSAMQVAIHAAAILPKHVLLYGSKGDGKPQVNFDYLDGHVSNARIITSSGDKDIDAAAIEAVQKANYPPTPVEYTGKKINCNIAIDFGTYSPAQSTSAAAIPATTE